MAPRCICLGEEDKEQGALHLRPLRQGVRERLQPPEARSHPHRSKGWPGPFWCYDDAHHGAPEPLEHALAERGQPGRGRTRGWRRLAETHLQEQGGGCHWLPAAGGTPKVSPARTPGESGLLHSQPGASQLACQDAARTCEHPGLLPLRQPQPPLNPRMRCQRLLNFPL